MTGKDTNVLRKTPDEIKKGLECCTAEINECDSCPYREYNWCEEKLKVDALELLGDLFKDREERDDLAEECQNLEQRLTQAERERDAMMRDMKTYTMCGACKHFVDGKECPMHSDCDYAKLGKFEWRGVCEENSKEAQQ